MTALCWCGVPVAPNGFHLELPTNQNAYSGSYFKQEDGVITHHREKPERGT